MLPGEHALGSWRGQRSRRWGTPPISITIYDLSLRKAAGEEWAKQSCLFRKEGGRKRSGAAQAARRPPALRRNDRAAAASHASAAVYSRDRCLAAQRCPYLRWYDYDKGDKAFSSGLQPPGAEPWAVGALRSPARLLSMSERLSAAGGIAPTSTMGDAERALVHEGPDRSLRHLSAEIRSPNKSTAIKDLSSRDLGAHKLEQ